FILLFDSSFYSFSCFSNKLPLISQSNFNPLPTVEFTLGINEMLCNSCVTVVTQLLHSAVTQQVFRESSVRFLLFSFSLFLPVKIFLTQ
ncbi:MAG: hypothetical protein WCR95_08060, partial [Eubacteriales bacterium]